MEQNEYKKNIMKQAKPISDNLFKLFQNPEDKKATQNIANWAEEIRYKSK